MSIKNRIFILLVVILFSINLIYSQDSNVLSSGTGIISIFYNSEPDSVLIDGKKVDHLGNRRLILKAGSHYLNGYLKCHEPIETKFKLNAGRVIPLRLKFRSISSSKYDALYTNFLTQIGLTSGAFSTSYLIDTKRYYAYLPLVLLNTSSITYWYLKQRNCFDSCSKQYNGIEFYRKGFKLTVGISALNFWGKSVDAIDHHHQDYILTNVYTTWDLYTKREVTFSDPENLLSNVGPYFEIEKSIFSRFAISGQFKYFPNLKSDFVYTEHTSEDFPKDPDEVYKRVTPLILYQLEAKYVVLKNLNNIIYVSAGLYNSNTIQYSKIYEIQPPEFLGIHPEIIKIKSNYKFKARGIHLGLSSIFYFNEYLSTSMVFSFYTNNEYTLDRKEFNSVFLTSEFGLNLKL